MQQQVLEFISKTGKPPYYSMTLGGMNIKGIRTPKRFLDVWSRHYEFKDKHVCVIGSNTGGIIFGLSDIIREGTGLDGNLKNLNASLKITSHFKLDHHLNFFECHQELSNFNKFNQITDDAEVFIIPSDTAYGNKHLWYDWCLKKGSDIIVELRDKTDNADLLYFKDKGFETKLIQKGSPDDPSVKRSSYLIQQ